MLTQTDYNTLNNNINTQIQVNSNNMIVFGSYNYTTGKNASFNINLGFKPRILILYGRYNNEYNTVFDEGTVNEGQLCTILTQAYVSSHQNESIITNNGFTLYVSYSVDIDTIYYVAIR